MRGVLEIAGLTLREAGRRRILLAGLACGGAFLALFGVGLHFVVREMDAHGRMTLLERRTTLNMLTLAGLYAANFLTVMAAVLLPVDTLSGEIQSGVIQTLAVKPVRRGDIVMGKWLGHALVLAGYLALLVVGVLAIARLLGQFTPPHLEQGLPLMLLEGLLLLTLAIAGGTRLSTIANGMLAFGLFGLAFVGNMVEQIGTRLGNDAARYVGTVASLIMPSESMWQLAASRMQPTWLRELGASPFSPVSVPSPAMVAWAAAYIVATLIVALVSFRRRTL